MKINESVSYYLNNVYSYDIRSCHYSILKNLCTDLSNINENDKEQRNIEIGKKMRDNPKLIKLLRNTTEKIIDEYIRINNIDNSEIVIRQYDGLLLTKKLNREKIDLFLPLELQNIFDKFLISINRNMYISFDSQKNKLKIKGVSHQYERMNYLYEKIIKLNFAERGSIFKGLQKIKNYLFECDDIELFCIPFEDKYSILLKEYGEVYLNENSFKLIDINEVDKQKYFDIYILPFSKSIVWQFS